MQKESFESLINNIVSSSTGNSFHRAFIEDETQFSGIVGDILANHGEYIEVEDEPNTEPKKTQ